MKESDTLMLALFDRCLQEAVDMRREQTEIPSPFADRGDIEDTWLLCSEFYDGDHWRRMGAMPSWKCLPVENVCFQAVETYTTKLTDSRPRCGFVAREVDDQPTADLLQTYYDYWWEQEKGATALYLGVKDSRKFGTGWLHLEWSPSRASQRIHALHPEAVLVDPDCTIDDFDPSYLIYEYVAQTGNLKEAFPKAPWDEFQQNKTQAGFFERILRRFNVNTTIKNPAKSTTVYELWIRDASTVEFDVGTEEYSVKARKKAYPGGRVLTIAGGIILDDRPNPYKHGRFPFVPISAYPETGRFYGHGDVSRLIPMQVLYNRILQYLFDATFKSTGGIYLVNKALGLAKTSITNDPVQIRECKDVNGALRVVQPPSPPRHMFDMLAQTRKALDDAIGSHEISRGTYTPGNKTVAEVNVLAESDTTRVRMAARFLAQAIETLGGMWLSNVAQFEDKDTIIRIAGEEGKPESVAANPAMLVRRPTITDSAGTVVDWETLPLDIKVADTSTLPARQQELAQQAMGLAQMGAIDTENLLDTLDWPDRKAMLARQEQKAQAQAQQQAMQPPQGAPQQPQEAPPAPQGAPPQQDPIQAIADATGLPIEVILQQLQGQQGNFDTAFPGGFAPQGAPVPEGV